MNRLEEIVEEHYSRMYDDYNRQDKNDLSSYMEYDEEDEELERKFESILQEKFSRKDINRLNYLYDGRRFGENEDYTRIK